MLQSRLNYTRIAKLYLILNSNIFLKLFLFSLYNYISAYIYLIDLCIPLQGQEVNKFIF